MQNMYVYKNIRAFTINLLTNLIIIYYNIYYTLKFKPLQPQSPPTCGFSLSGSSTFDTGAFCSMRRLRGSSSSLSLPWRGGSVHCNTNDHKRLG